MKRALRRSTVSLCLMCLPITNVQAGPYSFRQDDPANPHDPPIPADDPMIIGWATSVVDYTPAPGVIETHDNPANALGPADLDSSVSLGDLFSTTAPPPVGEILDPGPPVAYGGDPNDLTDDYGFIGIDAPGSITLGVSSPITDGPDHDFAVFERGFGSFTDHFTFAELAFVEVSTNGTDFARFPGISTVCESGCDAPLNTEFGRDFALLDPTAVFNLAGKHVSGWGTPFNLSDLSDHPAVLAGDVDLDEIRFLRFIDIPGNGEFVDSTGNPIFDTWVGLGTGGFDLDAVGVINTLPEPAHLASLTLLGITLRRNRQHQRHPHKSDQ